MTDIYPELTEFNGLVETHEGEITDDNISDAMSAEYADGKGGED